jgi:hypothetical protein
MRRSSVSRVAASWPYSPFGEGMRAEPQWEQVWHAVQWADGRNQTFFPHVCTLRPVSLSRDGETSKWLMWHKNNVSISDAPEIISFQGLCLLNPPPAATSRNPYVIRATLALSIEMTKEVYGITRLYAYFE